jgi:hypothetical protein
MWIDKVTSSNSAGGGSCSPSLEVAVLRGWGVDAAFSALGD